MKLVSWNVNGLRACIKKGFENVFSDLDADIFCLQETKLQTGQVELELPGYGQYWCCAEKKGYSGTAVFTRVKPLSVSYNLGIAEHDKEGRVITAEFDSFFLVCVYTPNAQDGLKRLDYRMGWEDAFREHVMRLNVEKPVIICGDLNVAHNEIDLKNPKGNRNNPGFTDAERGKFTQLLEAGLVDTFRYLHPDAQEFSWWSYRFNAREKNIGWRIDYFLTGEQIKGLIVNAKIHSQIYGSDHCPVELEIEL